MNRERSELSVSSRTQYSMHVLAACVCGTIRELHTAGEGRKKQGKGIFVSQECKPLYRQWTARLGNTSFVGKKEIG